MAVSHQRAPFAVVGDGLVFFETNYVGHITSWSMSLSFEEIVGRYQGHVINNAVGNKDCMVNMHFDDWRPDMARFHMLKLAKNFNSATEAPSAQDSAQFSLVEPAVLVDSSTAKTMSVTGGSIKEVWKKDLSVKYTDGTSYTDASSEVTIIGGGSITDGEEVYVVYTFEDSDAVRLEIGRGHGFLKGALRVVFHDHDTGYLIQGDFPYASPVGGSEFALGQSEWAGHDAQYRVLADLSADAKYGTIRLGASSVASIVGN